MLPSVIVAVMLYTLSISASIGFSKSVVALKVNTPPAVKSKSAASVPVRTVLKVGVDPSSSVPVRVSTAVPPSATENALAEVIEGILSFVLITVTEMSCVAVSAPEPSSVT